MNIWIYNHYAVGPGSAGFTRHYDLAKELVKKGISVTIFASSFNYQTKKEEKKYPRFKYHTTEEIDGVRFVWIKTLKYEKNNYKRVINMLEFSLKAYLLRNKFKDTPTHVIGSLMHPFAAITGAKVAKSKKTKFIFEERDLWPQSMIDLGNTPPDSFKVKILKWIEQWLINSADKVLILFEKARIYMKNNGVSEDKIMVVSNGVSLENYTSKKNELPTKIDTKLKELEGKFLVTYTGAHGMANNLDMVLDSAKQLLSLEIPEIHFLFLGDGVKKNELMKRKNEEGLDNVTFLNPIKKELMPAFLRKVDVGLLPLHDSPVFNWGISPNKMYDYMASKLPVIILTDIDKDALHESNPSFLIRQDQSNNLVKKLIELKDDNEELQRMGNAGLDFIKNECSWEVLSEKFINQLK